MAHSSWFNRGPKRLRAEPAVRWAVAAGLAALGCGGAGPLTPAGPPVSFALTHVAVIDATGTPAQPDMTVVVGGARIAALGPTAVVVVPTGVRVVDARAKFLIPGLWDMHVHTGWDRHFTVPLMIANGVTGVREMYGRDLGKIRALRADIAAGKLIGPRIVSAGPIVDGPNAPWPGSVIVTTVVQARRAVDDQQAAGADFIKVYSGLDPAAYFAIADEARKRGIPFAGHVPDAVAVSEASDSGQRSMEHLNGVLLGASTREAELRAGLIDPRPKPGGWAAAYIQHERDLLDSFSEEKAASLFDKLRANDTWQVPTLSVARVGANPADPALAANPAMRYVPYTLRGMWGLVKRFAGSDTSTEHRAVAGRIYDRQRWVVGAMARAGVPLLAGTDEPNAFVIPGFSLHEELGLLVQAGLTPMAALQAATSRPAKFLGTLDTLGTIETNKIADLVLLAANPLDDIGNTRRIDAVVVRGRLIQRGELNAILAGVESSRWRLNEAALTLTTALLNRLPSGLYWSLAAIVASVVSLIIYMRRRRRRRVRAG